MSLYLNFRGTFTNSGGHIKSFIKFLPVKVNIYPKFLFIFYLNLSSMLIVLAQEGVIDSEVVSAIALVLNSPANLLFLLLLLFLALCYEIRSFCNCFLLVWLRNQYPMRHLL